MKKTKMIKTIGVGMIILLVFQMILCPTHISKAAEDWTEWSDYTNFKYENAAYLRESRLCYRYCDGVWGSYSGWSDSAVSGSSTRQVETKSVQVTAAYTQYQYCRYVSTNCSKGYWRHFCAVCGHNMYGGDWNMEYTDWMNSPVTTLGVGNYCQHGYSYKNDGMKTYIINGQNWYRQDTRTVPATYKTQYRYRDLSYPSSGWSVWGTTAPSTGIVIH